MAMSSNPHHTGPNLREDALTIFNKAVESVVPKKMVTNALHVEGNCLSVDGKSYNLKKNVYAVGVGKASLGMLRKVEDLLSEHIVCGVASVPKGIQESFLIHGKQDLLLKENSVIKVIEGAYRNLPDEDSFRASQEILSLVKQLKEEDILLVCITGGGSSLLSYPVPSVTVEDLVNVTKLVARSGGDIKELNTVRQNLEVLKAGGLARAAYPAQVVSLILSDIIGDPLDLIASGPTVNCRTSAKQCLDIFEQYKVKDKVPDVMLKFLQDKEASQSREEASARSFGKHTGSANFSSSVQNVLVGSNAIALQAAVCEGERLGYHSFVLSSNQEGEAREVAISFAEIANFICLAFDCNSQGKTKTELVKKELELVALGVNKELIKLIHRNVKQSVNEGKPLCMVNGGETTVKVKGHGQGGRNTEFALAAAIKLNECITNGDNTTMFDVGILSAGTDGQDGSCSAAGALAEPSVVSRGMEAGLDAGAFLENNDSYTFFEQLEDGRYLVNTGLTGTNVMDIQLLMVHRHGNLVH